MKIIFVFPIILSALFNRAGINPGSSDPFKTITITPLYLDKDSKFIVKGRSGILQIKVYLSNDMYQDKVLVDSRVVSAGATTFRYDNSFTRSTNQLRITYYDRGSWVSTGSITLKPIFDSYRTVNDNQGFSSKGLIHVFNYADKAWSSHAVNYSFTNFDDLYIPDYYHKINLNDFSINIPTADQGLFTCVPSLVINNVDGVFDDISTDSVVEIPLAIRKIESGCTFDLKDKLYVHKETLRMSSTQKQGYVATNHIFLPRNEMKNVEKYRAFFALQDFGIDHDFVRHDFELRALKNIIGDCQNSEYCIQRL